MNLLFNLIILDKIKSNLLEIIIRIKVVQWTLIIVEEIKMVFQKTLLILTKIFFKLFYLKEKDKWFMNTMRKFGKKLPHC